MKKFQKYSSTWKFKLGCQLGIVIGHLYIRALRLRALRPPNHSPFPYPIPELPKYQPRARVRKRPALIQHRDPPHEQRTQHKPSNGQNDDDSFVLRAVTHEWKGHKEGNHSTTCSNKHWCTMILCPNEALTPTWARRTVRCTSERGFLVRTWRRCCATNVRVRDGQTSSRISQLDHQPIIRQVDERSTRYYVP